MGYPSCMNEVWGVAWQSFSGRGEKYRKVLVTHRAEFRLHLCYFRSKGHCKIFHARPYFLAMSSIIGQVLRLSRLPPLGPVNLLECYAVIGELHEAGLASDCRNRSIRLARNRLGCTANRAIRLNPNADSAGQDKATS